jgi:hypothetical protein
LLGEGRAAARVGALVAGQAVSEPAEEGVCIRPVQGIQVPQKHRLANQYRQMRALHDEKPPNYATIQAGLPQEKK